MLFFMSIVFQRFSLDAVRPAKFGAASSKDISLVEEDLVLVVSMTALIASTIFAGRSLSPTSTQVVLIAGAGRFLEQIKKWGND